MRFQRRKASTDGEETQSKYNAKKSILHVDTGNLVRVSAKELAVFKAISYVPEQHIIFDSELEAKYYRDILLPRVRAGKIKVEFQPKFTLLPKQEKDGIKHMAITYSPDFAIIREGRKTVYVDVKGAEDQKFPLKRKMFDAAFPDFPPLVVMKYAKKFGGWVTFEVWTEKKRAENKAKKASVSQ
ncbi:DUF1064 domain-containing protein [Paenibacillus cymbidii]|uniref:DUF1064 domain-containing protein n=1 Tax=Paenibacillus cymbidii TaxID=1639034 RepID=UPI0014369BFB|nr:DUF1064 domain-containing protein [Paenibacillus cymbidii]